MLASQHGFKFLLFIQTLAGISLVIASACVYNNYIDRDIDKKMARTQKRATATGSVNKSAALLYATLLGLAGFVILAVFTNWLVCGLGLTSLVFYVFFYGLAKRRSVHGTLVGSIPGAAPPSAGYLAVTNRVDSAAIILFLILVLWQMPHFYAISMYRYKDYRAASLPVLAVKKGMAAARRQIIAYIAAFILVVISLSFFGYTGYIYALIVAGLGFYWLARGIKNYDLSDEEWGKMMFLSSLIVSLGVSAMIAIGGHLP